MSIDIYKELNKELVDKVQELKKANAYLEKENVFLTTQYYDEHQLRLEERQKLLSVISRLKDNIDEAEHFITGGNSESECRSLSSRQRRTRSSGVTTRSPIRSRSSEQGEPVEQNEEAGNAVNTWGFHNIQEDSSEEAARALSLLNINEKSSQRKSQSSNSIPAINVSSSIGSSDDIENTIDVPRTSRSFRREEHVNGLQNLLTPSNNLSNETNFTISDFSTEGVHSTPKNHEVDTTECSSPTLTMSNVENASNSTLTRPRRNCAPISFAEPSLSSKLRNESAPRKSKKGKKKR